MTGFVWRLQEGGLTPVDADDFLFLSTVDGDGFGGPFGNRERSVVWSVQRVAVTVPAHEDVCRRLECRRDVRGALDRTWECRPHLRHGALQVLYETGR